MFFRTCLGRAYVRGANRPLAPNCTANENPAKATLQNRAETPNVKDMEENVDMANNERYGLLLFALRQIRQALAPEASAMVVVVDPEEGLVVFFSPRHQVSTVLDIRGSKAWKAVVLKVVACVTLLDKGGCTEYN